MNQYSMDLLYKLLAEQKRTNELLELIVGHDKLEELHRRKNEAEIMARKRAEWEDACKKKVQPVQVNDATPPLVAAAIGKTKRSAKKADE